MMMVKKRYSMSWSRWSRPTPSTPTLFKGRPSSTIILRAQPVSLRPGVNHFGRFVPRVSYNLMQLITHTNRLVFMKIWLIMQRWIRCSRSMRFAITLPPGWENLLLILGATLYVFRILLKKYTANNPTAWAEWSKSVWTWSWRYFSLLLLSFFKALNTS